MLVGEIFHRKFNNRRQLASYVGYAPSPFQSGNVAHDQGISKAGNRKGRTTGIELAWLWLRYHPDSDLSVWFRARVGTTKGRIRRIAIVAMARKLLVALRRYLETGVVPQSDNTSPNQRFVLSEEEMQDVTLATFDQIDSDGDLTCVASRKLSSWCSQFYRVRRAGPWRALWHRHWPRNA